MRFFLALAASLFLCLNSYAATVDSVQIIGSPVITEADVCTLARIPDSVVELFHQKGGRIFFVSAPLEHRYADYDVTVYGLYYEPTHRIYIRNGSEVGYVLAHEMGHFLFHETRPSWSADVRAMLNDSEAFAEIYALYCVYGTAGDMDAAIHSIHLTAEKLLERGKNAE